MNIDRGQIVGRGLKDVAIVVHLHELAPGGGRAASRQERRWLERHPGHLSACGYELNRLYNVVEKSFERLCAAFENHFEKSGDYHERLLERMALELPGIRPRFLPPEDRRRVRELKSFRHFFRHAYDPILRIDRLAELVEHATEVAAAFPCWTRRFCDAVRKDLESE